MRERLWKFLATAIFTIAVVIAYGWNAHWLARSSVSIPAVRATSTSRVVASVSSFTGEVSSTPVEANAQMVRVVDGDTLIVRYDGTNRDDRIRLLGINTPEVVDPRKPVECFGKEASAYMHKIIDGKRIRLEGDPQADDVDKYGRLLRNVFLTDGTDINAMMVRDGYAYAYLFFPLNPVRKQQLKKLENSARIAQRGLWSPKTCNGKK